MYSFVSVFFPLTQCFHEPFVFSCIFQELAHFLLLSSDPFMDILPLFIHSHVDGYLSYFQFLAIMNKTTTDICI